MKKKIIFIAILLVALVFSTDVAAQKFSSLDKSPHDISYFKTSRKSPPAIKVIYGRPQKKGRTVFGNLVPYGKVWRTGANEAPEITFYKDVTFGGTAVAAGTYSLFTIPGEGEWTIILNKNLNQWGAYSYDEGADAARVKASASSDGKSLEEFSVTFKEVEGGAHMIMGWGSTRVSVPVMM